MSTVRPIRGETRQLFLLRRAQIKLRGASFERSSKQFQAVALEVLRAHVAAYEAIEKRQHGADVPTPPEPLPSARGPLLSEALDMWKTGWRPGARV
jgi:hypothetical protein